MYKIIFWNRVIDKIGKFIDSVLQKKLELIEDSGIDDLAFIRKNYIWNSEAFEEKIFTSLLLSGSQQVLWKMLSERWTFFIVSSGNFRFFVYYQEDTENLTRYIEDIEFFRK